MKAIRKRKSTGGKPVKKIGNGLRVRKGVKAKRVTQSATKFVNRDNTSANWVSGMKVMIEKEGSKHRDGCNGWGSDTI